MTKIKKTTNNHRKLVLGLAIVFSLFFQSIGQSFVIKCPAMAEAAMASQKMPSSHEGHMDMSGGESHDATAMSGKGHEKTHGHICPPAGCDICTADDCSQCSLFQLNSINHKTDFWYKSQASLSHALAVNIKAKLALLTWIAPPTRAPPLQ